MKKAPNFALAAWFVLSAYAAMAQAPVGRERSTPDEPIRPVPAHSALFPYHSQEAALTFDLRQSAYCLFLNGNWKFRWYAQPDNIKPELFGAGYSYESWEDMPVPSHWQLAGLRAGRAYDHPSPVANRQSPGPAGIYQTTFKTPPAWQDRKVFLHLAGILGSASVWLNGKRLGTHDDPFLPVEFDVTPFLQKEKNSLVVEVVSRAGAQAAGWQLSGIDRDVFLFATPYIHARDFEISSFYVYSYIDAEDYPQAAERMRKYSHHTDVYYKNYAAVTLPILGYRENITIWRDNEIALGFSWDSLAFNAKTRNIDTIPHLKPLEERSIGHYCPECYQLPRPGSSEPVKGWRTWSAEAPYLYKQVHQLTDDQNVLTEVFASPLGIRDARVTRGRFQINGRPVKLKGVHYAAFDPDNGRAVSEAIMVRDIKRMKQHNINAVWLSHPHPVRWYELCDAYGLYVIDQYSGPQTAATGTAATSTAGAGTARAGTSGTGTTGTGEVTGGPFAMVKRDHNFASVVAWSWTDGAGWNADLDPLFVSLKQQEYSQVPRPVVFLASKLGEVPKKGNFQLLGMTSIEQMLDHWQQDKNRPLLLAHYLPVAGGDSLGSLKNAVYVVNQNPGFAGIFLRQWADQEVRRLKKDGAAEWVPGPVPPDGLLQADGSPKDRLLEVKKAFQSVRFATADLAVWKVRLTNEYDFINLDFGALHWQLEADGVVLQEGTVGDLSILPRRSKDFLLPVTPIRREQGKQYALRLGVRLKEDCPWAEKGFEV
ncbi:MAG: DUF4981 domain-containing protein, partial [Cytophagales bacterium]|nr:DUF4981 domain-containing protein [Cytophagales bacterium]